MDTSEKYIKMCKQAQEIQKLDFTRDLNSFYSLIEDGSGGYITNIWLPRQDQLQEIVREIKPSDYFIWGLNIYTIDGGEIYSPGDVKSVEYFEQFDTFEQLWLAFVMKEKYNKTWNDQSQSWELAN